MCGRVYNMRYSVTVVLCFPLVSLLVPNSYTDQECLRMSILSKNATPIETHSLVKIIGTVLNSNKYCMCPVDGSPCC